MDLALTEYGDAVINYGSPEDDHVPTIVLEIGYLEKYGNPNEQNERGYKSITYSTESSNAWKHDVEISWPVS